MNKKNAAKSPATLIMTTLHFGFSKQQQHLVFSLKP